MPIKKKSERQPVRELPKLPKEMLDQLPETLMTAEAIEEASAAFKKALIERTLNAGPPLRLSAGRAAPRG